MEIEQTEIRGTSTEGKERETDAGDAADATTGMLDLDADVPPLHADAGATTLAHLPAPRASTPTTLALVSDPHVSAERSGTWKVFHRTEARFQAALADAAARDVDGVVVAGDLTEDGRAADFDRVADLLAATPVPTVAVPGNHDVPKAFKAHETPAVADFAERFAPAESLPFHERLGGVDVLGLDTASAPDDALADSHDGAVSPAQRDWLADALGDADAPLVVSHHNLPGLDDCLGDACDAPHPPIRDAESVVDALAGHDALHVSGHVHLPAITECGSGVDDAESPTRGLVCPPLSSFPQAYTLAEIGPDGTTLRLVPVADPDGVAEAHDHAREESERAAGIVDATATQLADLPLADER